jgi:hypothetical protein
MGFFSRPNGDWIVKRFGPKLRIEFGDERVAFTHGSQTVSLAPTIRVAGDRIVAVGEDTACGPGELINVYGPAKPAYDQALSKFLMFGINQVLARRFTIRPNVTISLATRACTLAKIIEGLDRAGVRNPTVA